MFVFEGEDWETLVVERICTRDRGGGRGGWLKREFAGDSPDPDPVGSMGGAFGANDGLVSDVNIDDDWWFWAWDCR